jgi:hypothetical protein
LQYDGDAKYKPAAKYFYRCKDFVWDSEGSNVFESPGRSVWGCSDYLKRKKVLGEYLEEDGSLVIEIDLQITADSKRVWYPPKLKQEESWVQFYSDSSSTSDVIFVVGGTDYHAHKIIISLRAKTLYDLCKEYITNHGDDNDGPHQPRVPLSHMKGETFRKILEYIYTVNTIPKMDNVSSAKDLLLAADRFDCTHLKLYVESTIVDKFLTTDNAASMLILGDSHSLALLKEAAMIMYASDPSTVQESEGWSEIQESNRLLEELLGYVSLKLVSSKNGETPTPDSQDIVSIDNIDVTSIREKLQDMELNVDGSREILVDRVKCWWYDRCS